MTASVNPEPSNGRQPQLNSLWTSVDEWAKPHLIHAGSPFHSHLDYTAQLQADSGLPDIAVSPLQGKFLALQCKLVRARNALEFGTLAGYSTIWIASSSAEMRVCTIEYDAEHVQVARQAFEHAGLSNRVEILYGAGLDVVPVLKTEIEAGTRERFDFVFIDADKQNNKFYFDAAVEMCNPGACIIVDNVVRRGAVASEKRAQTDSKIRGSREVIEAAGKDPRVDATMIQTVGEKTYDGFLMAVVKG